MPGSFSPKRACPSNRLSHPCALQSVHAKEKRKMIQNLPSASAGKRRTKHELAQKDRKPYGLLDRFAFHNGHCSPAWRSFVFRDYRHPYPYPICLEKSISASLKGGVSLLLTGREVIFLGKIRMVLFRPEDWSHVPIRQECQVHPARMSLGVGLKPWICGQTTRGSTKRKAYSRS